MLRLLRAVCRVCKNHHRHQECLDRGCRGGYGKCWGSPCPRARGYPEALAEPRHGCLGTPAAGWAPVATTTPQNPTNPCCTELRWLKGAKLAEKRSKLLVSYCRGCSALHQAPHRCSGASDRTTFWSNGALVRCCFFTSGRQRVTLSPCSLLMRSPI